MSDTPENQDAAADQTAPVATPDTAPVASSNDIPQTQPATEDSPVNVAPNPTEETQTAASLNARTGAASSTVSSAPGDVSTIVPVNAQVSADDPAVSTDAATPATKIDADGNEVPAAEVDAKAETAVGKLEGFFQHLDEEAHEDYAKIVADIKAFFAKV